MRCGTWECQKCAACTLANIWKSILKGKTASLNRACINFVAICCRIRSSKITNCTGIDQASRKTKRQTRSGKSRGKVWRESTAIFFLCGFSTARRTHDRAHSEFLPQHHFDIARLDPGRRSRLSGGKRLSRGTACCRRRALTAMKFAVIQFPGSNCDQDCVAAINGLDGLRAEYVWHKETSLNNFDAIVLPGGFAYGDYLRCGAIARFSPVMKAVISDARAGKL